MSTPVAERMRALFTEGWALNRDNGDPAYAQLERRVAELVSSGRIAIGDRVPSERDLAEWTGVSRPTARAALSSLARTGMLERGVGRRGTTVAANAMVRDLGRFTGFTALAHPQGVEPGAQVLALTCGIADAGVAEALGLGDRERVWHLRRLRVGSDGPCILEESWLSAERFADLDRHDLSGSIYGLLRDVFGTPPVRTSEQLKPILADEDLGGALDVPVGVPLMLVEHTAFGAAGTPLEHSRDVHRPDRAKFLVDVAVTLD